MTRYLTPLAVLILILTLASLVRAKDAAGNVDQTPAERTWTVAGSTPPPSDWTFCVNEGQRCNFTGTREVRYGANGTFTEPRTFTGGVDCHNGVFGDPVPGVRKHCDTRNVGSPPPTPSSVEYVSPAEGATVSGTTPVRVRAPAGTDWIGVYACRGQSVGEDSAADANGVWEVQWDTRMSGCSNGSTRIDVWSYTDAGTETGYAARNVTISNTAESPPPPPPPPPPPSGEPGPIAGQGYQRVFADEFDTLDRSTWCNRQWWESAPPAGTQSVSGGVLHLLKRRADGFQNTTISSEPCGQANPKSFRHGYFEARMRWPGVQGAGPAFWLFSTRHATNPDWPPINSVCARNGEPRAQCLSAELDVFEGYGRHPNVFTGTLHRNSSGQYGDQNMINSNSWQPQGFRVADSWRTYSALWTGSEVRWYLDGQFSHSTPVWDSTNQPMHLILSHWNTPWQSDNATNSSTPDVMDVEVDWVRVWQR